MMRFRRLSVLAVSAALLTIAPAAHACLRAAMDGARIDARTDTPTLALLEAERRLDVGEDEDLREAVRLAGEARTALAGEAAGSENAERLVLRARVVEQIARSRATASSDADRDAAARELAALAGAHPNLVTDGQLAEARARVPALEDEAYASLRTLAEKDLVGNAWEQMALADLARARGHERVARSAFAACQSMAVSKRICVAHTAPPRRTELAWAGGAGLGLSGLVTAFARRRRAKRDADLFRA